MKLENNKKITSHRQHGPSVCQSQLEAFGSALNSDCQHFVSICIVIRMMVMIMIMMMMPLLFMILMQIKVMTTLTRRTQALQISSPRRSSSPCVISIVKIIIDLMNMIIQANFFL